MIIHGGENVYSPSDDSFLLIDYFKKIITENHFDGIDIRKIKNILDLGTGTGIIALLFQMVKLKNPKFNPKIYASDILEEALRCARLNEKANKFENKIKFVRSDLFKSFPDNLKHVFDVIVFNPPYLPSFQSVKEKNNITKIDYSWDGGEHGNDVIIKFLDEVKDFLNMKNGCHVYFISSDRTDLRELNEKIENKGFKNNIVGKKHVFFEDIILNRLNLRES